MSGVKRATCWIIAAHVSTGIAACGDGEELVPELVQDGDYRFVVEEVRADSCWEDPLYPSTILSPNVDATVVLSTALTSGPLPALSIGGRPPLEPGEMEGLQRRAAERRSSP